jgi:hypothetical protein
LSKASDHNCEHCGTRANDWHHTDYSQPLNVIALCRTCHNQIHHTIKVG